MFGLRAHPRTVALQRLQTSTIGATSDLFNPHQCECFWTDGSVQWGSYFWLSTGAYAVVDAHFQIVESGRVCRWELSAYTTELYALLRVIKRASCRIQVKSDCQSVVDQFYALRQTLRVHPSWSHQPWWRTARSQLLTCCALAPSSFLLGVVRPGAPIVASLLLVAMPGAPSK